MSERQQGNLEDAAVVEGAARLKRPMMTRGQVAKRLATSPSAVDRMQASGELHATEIDGVFYFDPDEVDKVEENLGLRRPPAPLAHPEHSSQVENNRLAVQMLAQLMAHTDKATKNALSAAEVTTRALEKTQARCEKLEDQLASAFEAMQSLADHKHQRDLEVLKAGAEQERRDKAIAFGMDKISDLWPIVKTKLFGMPISRGEHPAWDILDKLLNGLKAEQMNALLATLSADQTALFAELMQVLTNSKPKGGQAQDAEKKAT